MGSRHRGREYALQMLYECEASGSPVEEVVAHFWGEREVPPDVRAFAERLARGTSGSLPEIDALLVGSLDHWRLERLAIVDRNILRLALFEFLHTPETPRIVVIDEAIEVAKRFGGEESGQFVNGILDALRKRIEGVDPAITVS
ncbi:MAG TPA: transcription antitermination factor NusB [Candidatus Polarisedimenticolia bacterium]|nr:transcription antitermination factor NusB [Candidatus Polarisedimenticolia bacterium]